MSDQKDIYLLLLHEFGIGAVIHDITTKNRSCKRRIDFLSANISELAVKDKIITLGAQVNRGLLAKKNKSEDVAILHTSSVRKTYRIEVKNNFTFARQSKKNL